MDTEQITTDLASLTTLIDGMLSDIKRTSITETSKVMDFLLDARIIVARLEKELTAEVVPV